MDDYGLGHVDTIRLVPVCDDCGETAGRRGEYRVAAIRAARGPVVCYLEPPACYCLHCYHLARIQAAADGLQLVCQAPDGSTVAEVATEPAAA